MGAGRVLTYLNRYAWDSVGGGMWWDVTHEHKTSEPLGAATLIAATLYRVQHKKYFLGVATRLLAWADKYTENPQAGNLYGRSATDGTVMDYVEGMMVAAHVELCPATKQKSYCAQAEQIAKASLAQFPVLADWAPETDVVYLRWMLDLYTYDKNPTWYALAYENAKHAAANARDASGFWSLRWDGGTRSTRPSTPSRRRSSSSRGSRRRLLPHEDARSRRGGGDLPLPSHATLVTQQAAFQQLAEQGLAQTQQYWWDEKYGWYSGRRLTTRPWRACGLVSAARARRGDRDRRPDPANKAAVETTFTPAENFWVPTIEGTGGITWLWGQRNTGNAIRRRRLVGGRQPPCIRGDEERALAVGRGARPLVHRRVRWDPVNGGTWWDSDHDHKTSEPLAAAALVAATLYRIVHEPYFLDLAQRYIAWADKYTLVDGLYGRNATDGTVMDYVEGMMIAAHVELCEGTGDKSWCTQAESIAKASLDTFPTIEPWTPEPDAIYLEGMLDLYEEDGNPTWYALAYANATSAEANARDPDGFWSPTGAATGWIRASSSPKPRRPSSSRGWPRPRRPREAPRCAHLRGDAAASVATRPPHRPGPPPGARRAGARNDADGVVERAGRLVQRPRGESPGLDALVVLSAPRARRGDRDRRSDGREQGARRHDVQAGGGVLGPDHRRDGRRLLAVRAPRHRNRLLRRRRLVGALLPRRVPGDGQRALAVGRRTRARVHRPVRLGPRERRYMVGRRPSHKTSEPLAAAAEVAATLYDIQHKAYYLKLATKYISWADAKTRNPAQGNLYGRSATDGTVMDYVEGMMVAAHVELCKATKQQSWCDQAEQLAQASLQQFPILADWAPETDVVYLRGLLELYAYDKNPTWYASCTTTRCAPPPTPAATRPACGRTSGTGPTPIRRRCSRRRRRPSSSPGSRRRRPRRANLLGMTETVEAPAALKQINHWIGGRSVAGQSGRKGPVYNPATGHQSARSTSRPSRRSIAPSRPRRPPLRRGAKSRSGGAPRSSSASASSCTSAARTSPGSSPPARQGSLRRDRR